jgi:hypothetical protein
MKTQKTQKTQDFFSARVFLIFSKNGCTTFPAFLRFFCFLRCMYGSSLNSYNAKTQKTEKRFKTNRGGYSKKRIFGKNPTVFCVVCVV